MSDVVPAYRNAMTGTWHAIEPSVESWRIGLALCGDMEQYNQPQVGVAPESITCRRCARQVAKPETREKIAAFLADMRAEAMRRREVGG